MPGFGSALGITVGDLINTTRRHLLGTGRVFQNRLTNSVNTTDVTWTFDFDLKPITAGAELSIDDEIVYVWSTTPGLRQATVQRGQRGSTPAAHTAASVVYVNDRFPTFDVRATLQEEIRSWGPQVFRVVSSLAVGATSSVRGYDLTALNAGDIYDILDVRRSFPTTPGTTDPKTRPRLGYSKDFSAPTGIYPSGKAVFLTQAFSTTLPTIDIIASAPFDVSTFTDATDLGSGVGLDAAWIDIPPYGAAARMLDTREVRRTFTEGQGEPRDAQEVPPGFISSTAARLWAKRKERLADAQRTLMVKFPIRAA